MTASEAVTCGGTIDVHPHRARKGHPQSVPVYREAVEHCEEEESHTSAVTSTDASNAKSRSYQTPDSAVELVRAATDACKGDGLLELKYERRSGCLEPPFATPHAHLAIR